MVSINEVERAAAQSKYTNLLKRAHRDAGSPSYEKVAHKHKNLSKATVYRLFSGKLIPKKFETVGWLLEALEISEELVENLYKPEWIKMMDILEPLDTPSPTETDDADAMAATVCPKCGAWVADQDLHDAWHRALEERAPERHLRLVGETRRPA